MKSARYNEAGVAEQKELSVNKTTKGENSSTAKLQNRMEFDKICLNLQIKRIYQPWTSILPPYATLYSTWGAS